MAIIQLDSTKTIAEEATKQNSNNLYLDTKTTTNITEGTNLYYTEARVQALMAAGWIPKTGTFTYASADSPTFTMTYASDITSLIYPGCRIKLTQTTAKYFIVTASAYSSPNTTITLYGGTDYTLANSAISNVYFAAPKTYPQGFPMDPTKWSVRITYSSNNLTTNPTNGTWYNRSPYNITVPIGMWNLGFNVIAYADRSTAGTLNCIITLSTGNSTESDAERSATMLVNNATAVAISLTKYKILTVSSKTIYYLNTKTVTTSVTNIGTGSTNTNFIEAICAYL